jgi:hypothetical protein
MIAHRKGLHEAGLFMLVGVIVGVVVGVVGGLA